MFKSCIHTHSRFCDGAGEPIDYVDTAAALGFVSIGFSSHAPLPYPNTWAMKDSSLPEYLATIRGLKARRDVEVYLGLEIDYVHGVRTPADPLYDGLELDYRIGSVHCLGKSTDGMFREIDATIEMFREVLDLDFKGDVRALVETYYLRVAEMAVSGGFDVVGHLDLIKKSNKRLEFFSGDEAWYREAVLGCIPAIAASGKIVEVNTGGLARGKINEIYPSPWILRELRAAGIPATINADAHRPEHLDAFYDDVERHLKASGYDRLMILQEGSWREIGL
jgi:histidinol-phosphatase (PHP family)